MGFIGYHTKVEKINENNLTRSVLFEKEINLKGSKIFEAGYVFAPYITLFETPQIVGNFMPATTVSTRYATSKVNFGFYNTLSF